MSDSLSLADGGVNSSARYKRAPRVPLDNEKQALAAAHVPLARALAQLYAVRWSRNADAYHSAALFGLVQAAGTFEAARGVKFATFARYRIAGALRDVQRSMVLCGFQGEKAGPVPGLTGFGVTVEEGGVDVVGSTSHGPETSVDSADFVESWLRKLPRVHAEVCRRVYLGGRSQGETAGDLGLSKSRVSALHAEALATLRDEMGAQAAARPGLASPS